MKLETTVEDLINAEDSVYINEIKNNDVGFNNSSVTINHKSDVDAQLYEWLLKEKDAKIEAIEKEVSRLWDILNKVEPNLI